LTNPLPKIKHFAYTDNLCTKKAAARLFLFQS
jgi:hypothetical protein